MVYASIPTQRESVDCLLTTNWRMRDGRDVVRQGWSAPLYLTASFHSEHMALGFYWTLGHIDSIGQIFFPAIWLEAWLLTLSRLWIIWWVLCLQNKKPLPQWVRAVLTFVASVRVSSCLCCTAAVGWMGVLLHSLSETGKFPVLNFYIFLRQEHTI